MHMIIIILLLHVFLRPETSVVEENFVGGQLVDENDSLQTYSSVGPGAASAASPLMGEQSNKNMKS